MVVFLEYSLFEFLKCTIQRTVGDTNRRSVVLKLQFQGTLLATCGLPVNIFVRIFYLQHDILTFQVAKVVHYFDIVNIFPQNCAYPVACRYIIDPLVGDIDRLETFAG